MVSARKFIDFAPQTTLTAGVNGTATSLTVSSLSGWPSTAPFYAVIDYGTASAEAVLVTAIAGTTLTVTRNANGLGAYSHATNATLDHCGVALDFQEANDHHVASSNVHGLAVGSSVVGTTDAQTLTNKTLSGGTLSGTIGGNPTFSGNLTLGGYLDCTSGLWQSEVFSTDTAGTGAGSGTALTGSGTFDGTVLANPDLWDTNLFAKSNQGTKTTGVQILKAGWYEVSACFAISATTSRYACGVMKNAPTGPNPSASYLIHTMAAGSGAAGASTSIDLPAKAFNLAVNDVLSFKLMSTASTGVPTATLGTNGYDTWFRIKFLG